jgi:Ohr subfamily peroxiredoxin
MVLQVNEIVYTASVEVTGGRDGHARSSDGNLNVTLQRPAQVGKTATGTNPEQLFAAGYAACFQSALIGAAFRAGHNASKSAITANVQLGKTGTDTFGLAVVFDIEIPGVDQETAESLAASAHETCPHSNAVRANIDVTFNVSAT